MSTAAADAPDSQTGDLQPGSLLAERYEVRAMIGAGGFGLVYRAWDRVIQRDVALKLLRRRSAKIDDATYGMVLKRFWREAKAAGSVRNPNVVTIFDAGEHGEQPYLVMEFLPGHDLGVELHGGDEGQGAMGPMEPDRALHLVAQALMGLEEVHALGVVHKDLKPTNLFLVKPGTFHELLCMLDFGMAGLTEGDDKRLTDAGQLAGTARYFAPEYIEQADLTPAVDVYQMGLILVEMLTGKPVVDDAQVVVCVRRHKEGDLRLPEELMDSPLGSVLTKALARDPSHRYGFAREFADALLELDPYTVPCYAAPSGRRGPYRYVGERSTSTRDDEVKRKLRRDERRRRRPPRAPRDATTAMVAAPEPPRSPAKSSGALMLQLFMAFLFGATLAFVISLLMR